MPINEYQFFNGVVLNNLVRNELNKLNKPIKLDVFPSSGNNAFTINDKKVGIYIKYSKKIISPWRFTFLKEHQDEFKIMNKGSSLKFCLVASGIADIYLRLGPTSEWDIAAGEAVVKSAGGIVMNIDGSEIRYNMKNDYRNKYFIAAKNEKAYETSMRLVHEMNENL